MMRCRFCDQPAVYLAAQSSDRGKTGTYVRICVYHADGWNDGGDWNAPIYPLSGKRARSILKKMRGGFSKAFVTKVAKGLNS